MPEASSSLNVTIRTDSHARAQRKHPLNDEHRHIWETVSNTPLRSLWDFQGIPAGTVMKRTFAAFNNDNLLSRAAELGYYFLFALFPTLLSASAIFGLFARSASDIYLKLLHYLALVVPKEALGIVLDTFNQTTAHSSGGKVTFGLVAALWSASVGFSAIQDTLNTVYKVKGDEAVLEGARLGDAGDGAAGGNHACEPGFAAGRDGAVTPRPQACVAYASRACVWNCDSSWSSTSSGLR